MVTTKIELLKYGLSVFNFEKDKFKRWLSSSNLGMGRVVPSEIINTDEGRKLILQSLNRIEHGIFS